LDRHIRKQICPLLRWRRTFLRPFREMQDRSLSMQKLLQLHDINVGNGLAGTKRERRSVAGGLANHHVLRLHPHVRHRIVGTATLNLPVGHGKRFGGNTPGWANQIVGGWELTTLVDVYSGLPLSPTVTGTTAFAGTRPMIVPGVNPQTKGGYNHRLGGTVYGQTQGYLNPAAFAVPLSFQLGNMPRSWDKIRGPINFDDNASLIKRFPIHGQFGMEFRVEAFNVFNMVEFGLPNAQFNSSTLGQITTQANLPRNIQLALKVHF
jgi:hypothetical protein